MIFEENKSLVSYTTFGVDVRAKYFAEVKSREDVEILLNHPLWNVEPRYILGGGSNVLFTHDIEGIVVHNAISGIEMVSEDEESISYRVGAGENWHEFLMMTVDKGWWGIENLALIPGTVGGAPVQNIGAYGVEVKDSIVSVEVVDTENITRQTFNNNDCRFGYRQSIFKEYPGKYFITHVTFRLSKHPQPQLGYGIIAETLKAKNITSPISKDIAEAVIAIRNSKLPELGEIGMAGSFFKNPVVSKSHFNQLLENYPNIRYFELPDNQIKIPAGWLIETLGYKGAKEGKVGTYHNHALVLVNYGDATGEEVWNFAQKIITEVKETFDIILEPEVLVI